MKKMRFLVLALAVAVMMVGAGYAWWSEAVQIKTTVTTGALDVDAIACPNDTFVEYLSNSAGLYLRDTHYASASIAVKPNPDLGNDTDSVEINFNKLYPGSKGTAKFEVVNHSTMQVKLSRTIPASVVCESGLNPAKVTVTTKFVNEENGPDRDIDLTPVTVGGVVTGYTIPSTENDIFFGLNDSLIVTVTAIVDKSMTDGMDKDMVMTMTPKFIQFNDFEN